MIPIAILNLKGGVGKTTLTINLGAGLSLISNRILLADLDPQNDLTQSLGTDPLQIKGIEFLLTKDISFQNIVIERDINLHLLPSSVRLKDLILSLQPYLKKNINFSYSLLKNSLIDHNSDYDFMLIDCPPTAGVINLNILKYVRNVIIPVQCQYLSLIGLKKTILFIQKIKKIFNPEIKVLAIVPVMFDARTNLSQNILDKLGEFFPNLLTEQIINISTTLAESTANGKTIFEYQPNSRAARDFRNLAVEILDKIKIL